jgi:hypothetical protein
LGTGFLREALADEGRFGGTAMKVLLQQDDYRNVNAVSGLDSQMPFVEFQRILG